MDLMDMAVKALGGQLGGAGGNTDRIKDVIGKLVGTGDKLDLRSMVDGLREKGMGGIADSWLGDGDNEEIDENQVREALGESNISKAATELGTDEGSLLAGLKDMLPKLVDTSSKGGILMDSLGGLAKKFF